MASRRAYVEAGCCLYLRTYRSAVSASVSVSVLVSWHSGGRVRCPCVVPCVSCITNIRREDQTPAFSLGSRACERQGGGWWGDGVIGGGVVGIHARMGFGMEGGCAGVNDPVGKGIQSLFCLGEKSAFESKP